MSNIEVYNIRLQRDFDKLVPLPPVNVWTRVVDRGSFLTATLRIIVKRKGIFFNRQLVSGFYTCMLSRQGHLVIYTQHSSNEGYAVNLRRANKIVFKMLNNKEAPSSNSNKHPFQQLLNLKQTKVKAEWPFGTVTIMLPERIMTTWCCAIIGAASCDRDRRMLAIINEGMQSRTSSAVSLKEDQQQHCGEGKKEEPQEDDKEEEPQEDDKEEEPQEDDKEEEPQEDDKEEEPQEDDKEEEPQEDDKDEEPQEDDDNDDDDTWPAPGNVSDDDEDWSATSYLWGKNHGTEEKKEEGPFENDSQEDNSHEEKEEDANTNQLQTAMERHVTFSDLKTVFEMSETETADDEEETNDGDQQIQPAIQPEAFTPSPWQAELANYSQYFDTPDTNNNKDDDGQQAELATYIYSQYFDTPSNKDDDDDDGQQQKKKRQEEEKETNQQDDN